MQNLNYDQGLSPASNCQALLIVNSLAGLRQEPTNQLIHKQDTGGHRVSQYLFWKVFD